MVQINFGQREVSCKVVFYGPGMSGKTTNLEIIHKKAPKEAVGEMVSIATENDRTLYFDFLPLDLGQVAGMRTKFQLYTVPGQIYYNATRKLVLQGVDGVIFVADSSPEKMPENLESLQNLRDNLAEMQLKLEDIPLVLQYNKRDMPTAMSIDDMNAELNPMAAPVFEGVAREGKGVFATLKEISRLVIEKLNKENAPAANRRRTASNLDQAARSPSGGSPVQSPSGANKMQPGPPLPPPPPRPTAPPGPISTTPLGQNRLQPRPPAPAPSRPLGERTPAGGAHVAPHPPLPRPNSGVPQRTNQNTPAGGTPMLPPAPDEPSAKEKHLAKARPPAIDKRSVGPDPDLGTTDPNLRRYQEKRSGGGIGRTILLMLMVLIVLLLIAVLFVLVPPLHRYLPAQVQTWMRIQDNPSTPLPNHVLAPESSPAPAPSPVVAPPAPPAGHQQPSSALPPTPAPMAVQPAPPPAVAVAPTPAPEPAPAPAAPAAAPVAAVPAAPAPAAADPAPAQAQAQPAAPVAAAPAAAPAADAPAPAVATPAAPAAPAAPAPADATAGAAAPAPASTGTP